ncbi:MAG: SpoIIE family protein phosphatase, partial [Ignavibacteria bacterium]
MNKKIIGTTTMDILKNNYLILILIIFFSTLQKAQTIDTLFIHSDSLKEKPIALDDVWRFKKGDNLLWAARNYNDSGWDTLRSRMSFADAKEIPWDGIGWFRTAFKIDSTLRYKPIAFRVNQIGASAFYLNGMLVKELGTISDIASEEEHFFPHNIPFTVLLDSNLTYTIAVRYSNKISVERPDWYENWFGDVGFELSLREIDSSILNAIDVERLNFAVNIAIAGIFFALAALYFALFIFYSLKKENLYFALFNLCIAVAFCFSMMQRAVMSDMLMQASYSIVATSALLLVFPFYIAFLYSIFYEKLPKLIYLIFLISLMIVLIIVLNFAEELVYDNVILVSIFVLTLESLRIIVVAIKKNKPNSRIIGAGVIVFVFFILTLYVLGIFGLSIGDIPTMIIFFSGLFSLPLTMSVYLARDIAATNKDLKKQIITVKDLSEKELEHQKQTAELTLEAEKEKAAANEAELRARLAEAENERKSKELEEARQIQLSMLPAELPQLPNLDIAVYMQTATEVGGDYYDFHVAMDGTLTVVIGDATGHGMKAGTMVTAAKSIFNSYVNNPDIIFTFQEFTRIIKMMKLHSMSMCLSLLKLKGNQLEMSAAGMPHALLFRKITGDVEEIVLKGMPLGAVEDFPYKTANKQLHPGDSILLLSDGLPELFNSKKEMYGYERVTTEYSKVASEAPEEIIEHLKKSAEEWVGESEPADDITFVVL